MGVITIDASQVKNALKVIEQSADVTPALLAGLLDATTRQRMAILKANTPYQERTDPRYPTHLRDSYHMRAIGKDAREVYIAPISSAYKFLYVTEGTKSHNIFPNMQKALYWPGIQGGRPVAAVYNHITKANPFHERADQQYYSSGIDAKLTSATANGIADLITNNINSRNSGNPANPVGLGGIATSMLGLVALLSTLISLGGAALA